LEWRLRVARLVEGPRHGGRSAGSGVHLLDARVQAAASVELRDGAAILRAYRVRLRPLEHDLLEHLLAHAGAVVSSEALIGAVWKESPARTPEAARAQKARVATTINRLRHALGEAAEMIESTRAGYRVRSAIARAQGE
jgi:DNA-binding winged helix-turn-helix (wHTH) protein